MMACWAWEPELRLRCPLQTAVLRSWIIMVVNIRPIIIAIIIINNIVRTGQTIIGIFTEATAYSIV